MVCLDLPPLLPLRRVFFLLLGLDQGVNHKKDVLGGTGYVTNVPNYIVWWIIYLWLEPMHRRKITGRSYDVGRTQCRWYVMNDERTDGYRSDRDDILHHCGDGGFGRWDRCYNGWFLVGNNICTTSDVKCTDVYWWACDPLREDVLCLWKDGRWPGVLGLEGIGLTIWWSNLEVIGLEWWCAWEVEEDLSGGIIFKPFFFFQLRTLLKL